jgi:hypothetical protein
MAKIPVGVTKAIDELYRVRNDLKLLEAQEKELADTIKQFMIGHEVDSVQAKKAEAVITMKELREVDPEAYFEAIDGDVDKLLASVKVRVEANKKKDLAGADSYLGQEELNSICSVVEVASLSIKKLIPIQVGSPLALPANNRLRSAAR